MNNHINNKKKSKTSISFKMEKKALIKEKKKKDDVGFSH